MFQGIRTLTGKSTVATMLRQHFHGHPPQSLVTAGRSFPMASRVDVQLALDEFFANDHHVRQFGLHSPLNAGQALSIAQLLQRMPFPVDIGPLQHDEIDVGEALPARCVRQGIWLSSSNDGLPFAVLFDQGMQIGMPLGVHVEIAVPTGEKGLEFSQTFFRELERKIAAGRTYRGKVISLEISHDFTGRTGSVKVHRLHKVRPEDIILPEKTLTLLKNNLIKFIEVRDGIKGMGLSAKKGLLFYGAPGTGKTHTIHYLAGELPTHTMLLITAEQVGLLEHYFRLARFLQPSIVVVEDVDLIARERTHLQHPGQEILLNKLLNEMDGLREDADVIFILTTNRPDQLEPALASRPGRIDQAIEFPLPDEVGRAKLARLYGRGLQLDESVVNSIVSKTKGASAAFIKELMRRSAQVLLQNGGAGTLTDDEVNAALEEMVILGGSLNLKLLGAGDAGGPTQHATGLISSRTMS
jgi:ATPase family protein associated with various cellular activities (AAA)